MLLKNLSSQMGQRSEQGNRRVVELILQDSDLLSEISDGLGQKDVALLGDCAEVCAMLAERKPEWVTPLADKLLPLLRHTNTRVRWEAMHALALISALIPQQIQEYIPLIEELFRKDKSTIVRDYAVTAAGNLASAGAGYARKAYPLLNVALTLHENKHAKLAMEGLAKAAQFLTEEREDMEAYAELFFQHPKPSIRKAARNLLKAINAARV